jgi:[ribosomal protein S5]-alanine N-acetyltransferase
MIVAETERMWLAEWQADDWLEFRYIATNPRVMRYIGDGRVWEDGRIRDWVKRQIANQEKVGYSLWKLIGKESNRLIGFCGLQALAKTGEIEIGWWLAEECWGKGLATEAARSVLLVGNERFQLERIVAIAHPDNLASINIMKKIGLKFEKRSDGKELGLAVEDVPVVLYSTDRNS